MNFSIKTAAPRHGYYQTLLECGRVSVGLALPSIDEVLGKAREVLRFREYREDEIAEGIVDALCGGDTYQAMRREALDWWARKGVCVRDIQASTDPFDWIEVYDGRTRVRFVELGPRSQSVWLIDLRDFDSFVCTPQAHYGWVVEGAG